MSHRLRCGLFQRVFSQRVSGFHSHPRKAINELELLTVVVSIKLWAPKLQGPGVELLSDNATCVSVINSQHSPNVFMQSCLREPWLLLALYNITLIVRSVRGCDNWLADSLSRFHTTTTTTTTSLFLTLNRQISHHLQIARLIEAGGV